MAREPGRFTISENMPCYPSTDIIHNAPDGPVFTTGVDLENFDGVVYIRVADVIEMAEMLGMASEEEVTKLHKVIEKLTGEVEVLPKRIGVFTNELAELVNRFHDSLDGSDSNSELSEPLQIAKTAIEQPKRTNSDPFGLNGQKSGFTFGEGFPDLSADSSNESAADRESADSKG